MYTTPLVGLNKRYRDQSRDSDLVFLLRFLLVSKLSNGLLILVIFITLT